MNIIGYCRVSSDEQSHGFSLNAQEDAITRYCRNNNHDLLGMYKEDYTGFKDFNRPEWKKIEEYLKKNKSLINAILCVRWDRYSRNEAEAKKKMIELRKKYKLEIVTIENYTDPNNIEGDFLNSIHLHMAQMESKRNSVRTIDGLREGLKSGYWMQQAPFGYINIRDYEDKSTLEIDPVKGKIVLEAFNRMATGLYSREEVRHYLVKKYQLKMCKNNFANLLKKIVYTGKIHVKAYKDEPEYFVKGMHPPIITEILFDKVQLVLAGKTPKMVFNQNKENIFPLKNHLVCDEHNRKFTASTSKGGNGKRALHSYYHCQTGRCKNRIKVEELDENIRILLQKMEVKEEVIVAYKKILEDLFLQKQQLYTSNTKEIEKRVNELTTKIDLIDDKFINQEISSETYNKLIKKLTTELDQLKDEQKNLKDEKVPFKKLLNEGTHILPNINRYYQNASGETKQRIVGSIFDGKIGIENKKVRTANWKEAIVHLFNVDKDFDLVKNKKAGKNTGSFTLAPPLGLEPRTL
jgi:site-specific DNA recombinase